MNTLGTQNKDLGAAAQTLFTKVKSRLWRRLGIQKKGGIQTDPRMSWIPLHGAMYVIQGPVYMEVGEPQVDKLTRLGGVTRLFI